MISRVHFMGRVTEEEANRYVHFADCAYLSFQNNPLFNMTLPAKLQTYLACGAPILAAAGGESAAVIAQAGCGIAVQPELAALVCAVKEMADMTADERSMMSSAARAYFDEHFAMNKLVDQLEDLMRGE